jgi:hypothetical protein
MPVGRVSEQGYYFVKLYGECLEPLSGDGEGALIDPREPLEPMDFALVEHLDNTSQPEAENGSRSVCKIFLGVAALPDGERLWTFFCLRPEFIISIRETQLLRVHKVTALIDASDEPRRPPLLPEDHWIRQVVHSAPPLPSLTRQRAVMPQEGLARPVAAI